MFLKKQIKNINDLSKIKFNKNYTMGLKRYVSLHDLLQSLSPKARLVLIPQIIPQPIHSIDALKSMSLSELEAVVSQENDQYMAMLDRKYALKQIAEDETVDAETRCEAYQKLISHEDVFDKFAKTYSNSLFILNEKLLELIKIKKGSSFEGNKTFFKVPHSNMSSIEDIMPLHEENKPRNNLE